MISGENIKVDVVVAGGGMVGLTLGLALAKAGVATAVVDGIDPALVRPDEIMTLSGDTSYLRQLLGDVVPIDIARTLQDMYETPA